MINIKNLVVSFNDTDILKNVSFDLPSKGLISFMGPSGCGKTTLLNAIAGLINFKGKIIIQGKELDLKDTQSLDDLRTNKIGFVFQDYKLFDFETVEANIGLSLECKCKDNKKAKRKRIDDLIEIVDLKNKQHELVSTLSGGEKQRVSIARAICNEPTIILADEPTGNLDSFNSDSIMKLLKSLSSKSLIIVVSHDEQLCKKYSDQIFYMKDGKIIKREIQETNFNKSTYKAIKLKKNKMKNRLPFSFCFKHSKHSFGQRKFRTALLLLVASFSLIGIGLATTISNLVSFTLIDSYSSLLGTNKVIVTPKSNTFEHMILNAAPYEEVIEIKENYDCEENIGVYYWNDFTNYFTASNFMIETVDNTVSLPYFNLDNLNEIGLINECYNEIYFPCGKVVTNDDVIISVNRGTLNEICYLLQIPRTVDSFNEYLENNLVKCSVHLENSNWQYSVDFSLNIVGFTIDESNYFLHYNPRLNEYIFESLCGLSSTEYLNVNTGKPWDLIKSYYVIANQNRDTLLKDIKFNQKYKNIIAEILNDTYYKYIYPKSDYYTFNRITFLNYPKKDIINGFEIDYIYDLNDGINYIIPGCKDTYAMYPENLMMGFAKELFISSDSNYLNNVIDLKSYIKSSDDYKSFISEKTVSGYFAKMDGLIFNPSYTLIEGRYPSNYDEVVVSKGVIKELDIITPINKTLYLCFPESESILANGYINRNYKMCALKIVGVSSSDSFEINHLNDWSIMFFQIKLGISSFTLSIDSLCLDVSEGYENNIISQITKAFPKYNATSPINEIKESIASICNTIEIILFIVSISVTFVAIFLLSSINYFHYLEIKKDIGVLRCLGVSKKQSKKLIYIHSFILMFVSLLTSIIELILLCLALMKTMNIKIGPNIYKIFNPTSFIYMITASVFIWLFTSFIISRKLNRLEPLECFQ